MTPEQCREARIRLGWTEEDLAARCGLSTATIRYFETGRGRSRRRTPYAICAAFEAADRAVTSKEPKDSAGWPQPGQVIKTQLPLSIRPDSDFSQCLSEGPHNERNQTHPKG